jgi:hypothetical protein
MCLEADAGLVIAGRADGTEAVEYEREEGEEASESFGVCEEARRAQD